MTLKQRRFVEEFLIDLNGTQAATRAGYSRRSANRIASEILSKPDVQEAIADGQRSRSERTAVTQDHVLQRLAAIAFFDLREMFDGEGNLLIADQVAGLRERGGLPHFGHRVTGTGGRRVEGKVPRQGASTGAPREAPRTLQRTGGRARRGL